jgi:hypothetical protein
MRWGEDYVHQCRCNDAQVMVSNIRDAIDAWAKKEGQEEGSEKRERAEAALRGIHLAARSKHFQAMPTSEKERIGCMHFLVLAMLSISKVPRWYRKISQSYWAAFATVAVELISRSRKARAKIPTEDIVAHIYDIFRKKEDVKLRRDITNGLVHVMADTKTYDEWLELKKVLGRTIDRVFEYWLGAVREVQDTDDVEAQDGAAGTIEIWRCTAMLYAEELDSRSTGADVQQVELLGREVLEKGLLVLDIVESYYEKFKGTAAHECAERVVDGLYRLRLVKKGMMAQDGWRPLRTKAESVVQETDCQYVREHFVEIVRVVGADFNVGGGDMGDGDEGLPVRK